MIKKGEIVFVRSFGGNPLVRRVWGFDNKVVFVTDDSIKDVISLGFPRKDVFKYDPKLVSSMELFFSKNKWDWNKLISIDDMI
jgi:hypothetical protein